MKGSAGRQCGSHYSRQRTAELGCTEKRLFQTFKREGTGIQGREVTYMKPHWLCGRSANAFALFDTRLYPIGSPFPDLLSQLPSGEAGNVVKLVERLSLYPQSPEFDS